MKTDKIKSISITEKDIYIKIGSHRAYDKVKRLGVKFQGYYSFRSHYKIYKILSNLSQDQKEVLFKIKSVSLIKKLPSNFNEDWSETWKSEHDS